MVPQREAGVSNGLDESWCHETLPSVQADPTVRQTMQERLTFLRTAQHNPMTIKAQLAGIDCPRRQCSSGLCENRRQPVDGTRMTWMLPAGEEERSACRPTYIHIISRRLSCMPVCAAPPRLLLCPSPRWRGVALPPSLPQRVLPTEAELTAPRATTCSSVQPVVKACFGLLLDAAGASSWTPVPSWCLSLQPVDGQ